MEMIVFSLCLYLETNNASSRHGHMENKANIIDDEDADGEDDDDDRLKNQANRLLDLLEKKSFEAWINNGAECDYNWAVEGRKVQ